MGDGWTNDGDDAIPDTAMSTSSAEQGESTGTELPSTSTSSTSRPVSPAPSLHLYDFDYLDDDLFQAPTPESGELPTGYRLETPVWPPVAPATCQTGKGLGRVDVSRDRSPRCRITSPDEGEDRIYDCHGQGIVLGVDHPRSVCTLPRQDGRPHHGNEADVDSSEVRWGKTDVNNPCVGI